MSLENSPLLSLLLRYMISFLKTATKSTVCSVEIFFFIADSQGDMEDSICSQLIPHCF